MTDAAIFATIRGQPPAEIYGQFTQARAACEAQRGGFDRDERQLLHTKCALFANRLVRAPATSIADLRMKLEAADWLRTDPREALRLVRDDLNRIGAAA